MWTRHHKRRNTGRLILPAITVVVLSYFSFHAYRGDYGLNAMGPLQERVGLLESELNTLKKARTKLEGRLALINDGTLEKDMLDEQARRTLNFARENEIVIFRHDTQN